MSLTVITNEVNYNLNNKTKEVKTMGRLSDFLKNRYNLNVGGSTEKIPFLSLKDGKETYVRFLPVDERYVRPRFQHWAGKKSVTCPRTFEEPCAVCDILDAHRGKVEKEIWRKYKANYQIASIAFQLVKSGKSYTLHPDQPLVIVSLSPTAIETLEKIEADGVSVFDEEGVVIKVIKNRTYTFQPAIPTVSLKASVLAEEAGVDLEAIDIKEQLPRPKVEDIEALANALKRELGFQTEGTEKSSAKEEDEFDSFDVTIDDVEGADSGVEF